MAFGTLAVAALDNLWHRVCVAGQIERLAGVRRAGGLEVLLVDAEFLRVVQSGVLDEQVRQEVARGSSVDGDGFAIHKVRGWSAAAHHRAVLDVVDHQRADVHQLGQRQPVEP